MGLKSAKDELKGKAKEVAARVTGDRQRRDEGRAAKERARAQGLAETADATGRPAGAQEIPAPPEPSRQDDARRKQ